MESSGSETSPDNRLAVLGIPTGELANTATNALTLLLSVVGTVFLMVRAVDGGDPVRIIGCSIFAATLIAVYFTSTASHAIASPRPRRWFRILDQAFIYLLVVGTYTPFALVYLRSTGWWLYFTLLWSMALCGFFFKVVLAHRVDAATVRSYLVLGWMSALPMAALVNIMPAEIQWWILAGGVSYTLGTVFFVIDNPRYHCHAIWHTCALFGSGCHFMAVYLTPV